MNAGERGILQTNGSDSAGAAVLPHDAEALLATPVDRLSRFFTASEILRANGALEGVDAKAVANLSSMMTFVTKRLTASDPDLGRAGPVCPFARQGARIGKIRFANCDADASEEAAIEAVMSQLRLIFMDWDDLVEDETQRILHAFVITFSNLTVDNGASVIERVQKKLKTSYVSEGLMIGQFYPGCPESGVYNPDFRPLDAPVVSLAIRHMTSFDAPFMLEDQRHEESYVDRFGDAGAGLVKIARSRRQSRDPGVIAAGA